MRAMHTLARSSRSVRSSIAVAVAVLLACGTGCGGSDGPTGAGPLLTLAGRLERGATVHVVVHIGGDSLSGESLALSVVPADAADVAPDGTIVLRSAGPLTVSADLPDGTTVSEMFDVPAPPAIVFDLEVEGNRDIYRAALDGQDLARLTTSGGYDVHPTSGAGVVVFTSYRNGQADLYSVALDDGSEHRLTTTTEGELDPALSADGERLAFVATGTGVGRVWVAAGDATNAVRATDDAVDGTPEAAPAWGDGGELVFTSTATGSADLVTISASAAPTAPAAIASANTSEAEVEGAWSADGKRLAFISTRAGAPRLYLLDVAAERLDSLVSAGDAPAQPTWMADGRLVFATLDHSVSALHWLDPAAPSVVHDIPLPAGNPQHPAAVR